MSLDDKILQTSIPGRESPGFLSKVRNFGVGLGAMALSALPMQAYAEPNNVGSGEKPNAKPVPTANSTTLSPEKAYEKHFSEGSKLLSEKKFQESISAFNHALTAKPKDAAALNERGYAQFSLKNYNNAISDFKSAIESHPTYAAAYVNLGHAQLEKSLSITSKTNAQKLASKSLHNLYIGNDLGYSLNLTNVLSNVNFSEYHRKIRADPELKDMDISKAKHDITRGERRDLGIQLYNRKQIAAAHYQFRKIIDENVNDKFMKEAKRYEKRCRRKMARKGITAIALYQTHNK